MSTSRDNLPAVPEPIEPPLLDERTRKTLGDVRILLAIGLSSVVAIFGGGFAAYGQVRTIARDEGKAAAVAVVAGLPEQVAALNGAVTSLRDEVKEGRIEGKEQRSEMRGLREDLRIINPALPKLAKDGGQ